MMRDCRDCRQPFEPTDHQMRKHDYICIPCRRARDRQWRVRRSEAGRPVRTPNMPLEYHRAYNARYYQQPEKRALRAAQMRAYRSRSDVQPKVMARMAVRNAIRRGELSKGLCCVCGSSRVQAHHLDYSQPLAVVWLCFEDHRLEHAKAEGRA